MLLIPCNLLITWLDRLFPNPIRSVNVRVQYKVTVQEHFLKVCSGSFPDISKPLILEINERLLSARTGHSQKQKTPLIRGS